MLLSNLVRLRDDSVDSIERILPELRLSLCPSRRGESHSYVKILSDRRVNDNAIMCSLLKTHNLEGLSDVISNYHYISGACLSISFLIDGSRYNEMDKHISIIDRRLRELIGFCTIEIRKIEQRG